MRAKYFEKYGFIWVAQIVAIILYCVLSKSSIYKTILSVIVFELVFIVLLYYYNRSKQNIILKIGSNLIVNGIFTKIELPNEDINKFGITRNFLCKIMDWSLVTISTKSATFKIYTEQLSNDIIKTLNDL